ncbi:MAG: T9SS type A sorting domain-containing protein [Paludibacter sp.]|nr:T9SS type A sorting domain-containing protein [Paludibacter sp.]
MKLKIYPFAILIALFAISVNAQERLVNGNFPTYQPTNFSVWWPDGWTFEGVWTDNCMTADESKKIQFENVDAPVLRRVYQTVPLGIGTYQLSGRANIQQWDAESPYSILITDPNGNEVYKYRLDDTNQAYANFGPQSFSIAKDGKYKFSIQCQRTTSSGWSQAFIYLVSLVQIDGNVYDPDGDTFTGVKQVRLNSCNIVEKQNSIIVSSIENIESVSIISINGSTISKLNNIDRKSFEITKPSQAGVYFVQVKTKTQNQTYKLIN